MSELRYDLVSGNIQNRSMKMFLSSDMKNATYVIVDKG